MRYKYHQVFQIDTETKEKRLIYTFNNEMAAHDMVEFILKNDYMPPSLSVEEYETPA